MLDLRILLFFRRFSAVFFSIFRLLLASPAVYSNNAPLIQPRQKAPEQQLLSPMPNVRLSLPAFHPGRIAFPTESLCFPLSRVVLTGTDKLLPEGSRTDPLSPGFTLNWLY